MEAEKYTMAEDIENLQEELEDSNRQQKKYYEALMAKDEQVRDGPGAGAVRSNFFYQLSLPMCCRRRRARNLSTPFLVSAPCTHSLLRSFCRNLQATARKACPTIPHPSSLLHRLVPSRAPASNCNTSILLLPSAPPLPSF